MHPVPVGTLIRVISNDNNHSYRIGGTYTVSHVACDGTFRANDPSGRTGNWLSWDDCEPAGGSTWAQIASEMPEPLVRFLSCFDGIGDITLRESVIDAVLRRLPDLHERILAESATASGEVAIMANRPMPLQKAKESSRQ